MSELLSAFTFIFLAEMGDKTQILAMTFATKYRIDKVLLGIFLGVLLNHGLAVFGGALLTQFIPLSAIQILAGFMFLIFGLMSLKIDDDSPEAAAQNQTKRVVVTVLMAFFIGELGDKTQLTATTLSVESTNLWLTLAGCVSAMMVTSLIGILVGMKFGKSVPDTLIKMISALIFAFFGYQKLLTQTYDAPWLKITVYSGLLISILLYGIGFIRFRKHVHEKRETAFAIAAEALHRTTELLKTSLSDLCLTEQICTTCEGDACAIGQARQILESVINHAHITIDPTLASSFSPKGFNEDKLLKTLYILSEYLYHQKPEVEVQTALLRVKTNLENVLFGSSTQTLDYTEYLDWLSHLDRRLSQKLKETLLESDIK